MADYAYDLPEDRIARYPLEDRDASKLLVYESGSIKDAAFRDLPGFLPEGALMVFNDTKVVPARLRFVRPSGAHIEIFCLQPESPKEYNLSFAATSSCSWQCVIGNVKRWKEGPVFLYNPENDSRVGAMALRAELISREDRTGIVRFSWEGGEPFSKVLELCGNIPIPPYLGRETEEIDRQRYQTLYARERGSVAAPTAGLHFTSRVLEGIDSRGILRDNVCLHVGAGTFLPVKSAGISGHAMHREPFSVSRSLIGRLLEGGRQVIAVGTTSVRTLESLYYLGVRILENGRTDDVEQWAPYSREYPYSTAEALAAIADYMDSEGMEHIEAGTRIIIVPGFKFRVVDLLVTNFHQPESTLILLVSAFVGGDWKTIYGHALAGGYRFLSYGDSSLLRRSRG